MKRKLMLTLGLWLVPTIGIAADNDVGADAIQPTDSITPATAGTGPSGDPVLNGHAAAERVALLQEQNRLLEQHNTQLMIVLWSALAFAALVLVAFLGLVGFFTHRRLEQDKEALRGSLKSDIDEVRASTEKRISEWQARLKGEQEKWTVDVRESQQTVANSATESKVAPVVRRIQAVEHRLPEIELGQAIFEARSWARQSHVPDNELTSWLDVATKAAAMKDDFYALDYTLPEALSDIARLLASGAKFDAPHTTRCSELLQSLPSKFAEVVTSIRSRLASST